MQLLKKKKVANNWSETLGGWELSSGLGPAPFQQQ